ncbi:hypothetical protein BH09SUM1_BH09SUM1_10330 [soil metagenome]
MDSENEWFPSSFSPIDTEHSFQWYDIELKIAGKETLKRRLAGRVEPCKWSFSDPAMGYGLS